VLQESDFAWGSCAERNSNCTLVSAVPPITYYLNRSRLCIVSVCLNFILSDFISTVFYHHENHYQHYCKAIVAYPKAYVFEMSDVGCPLCWGSV